MSFEIFIYIILFIYGTIIGSFLNVVILRTQKKEQFVKGRSHCMSCNHVLNWYDLFPVLGWVFLGGKCRYCKAKIPPRYALVESLCGLSYAFAFAAFGVSINLAFAVVLLPVLICLSCFDLDTGEIEYWCPISIAGLGLTALALSLLGVTDTVWYHHLLGAVIISVPFTVLLMFGGMGGADVQLMAAAGLLLGFNIIPAALIGIFLGAIAGVVIKLFGKPKPASIYESEPNPQPEQDSGEREHEQELPAVKGTVMPFGPFLAIGIAVGYFYGDGIIDWYLGIMGL